MSIPRVSGGEPGCKVWEYEEMGYSPRERG